MNKLFGNFVFYKNSFSALDSVPDEVTKSHYP